MNFANLFRIALRALGNNKMRGFLTMLGIIIGVASVITMLAIGQGSKRSIRAQIAEMGSNMIMIHPVSDFAWQPDLAVPLPAYPHPDES